MYGPDLPLEVETQLSQARYTRQIHACPKASALIDYNIVCCNTML
jgi:hypothetical protein